MLFVAANYSEEIETRKTIKTTAPDEKKKILESRTDEPVQNSLKNKNSDGTESPILIELSSTQKDEPTTIKTESSTEVATESPMPSSTTSVALESTSESLLLSTVEELSNSDGPNSSQPDESAEDENEPDINNVFPLNETPKRKVVYINQQQNGKLNVHLELSDVSVIVIPNQKDPQLSLLGLLLKSAQKSNAQTEPKKKENTPSVDQHDEYSKYTHRIEENNGAGMPFIESRAPYKVDISSTLGQQPTIEIVPNSHQQSSLSPEQQFQPQFARSPIMQLLRPLTHAIHSQSGEKLRGNRIFKRSVDSMLFGDEPTYDSENYLYSNNDISTETDYNFLDNADQSDDDASLSEFVLLGATENCGPGRKRNSYQVCVSVADD